MAKHRNKPAIPVEVTKSWLRGEYLTGRNTNTAYENMGWSLYLRGIYLYAVWENDEDDQENPSRHSLSHFGLCTIDLDEGDLIYKGFRLYGNKEKYKEIIDQESIYWESLLSKINNVSSETPNVYFGYVLYENNESLPEEISHSFDLNSFTTSTILLEAAPTDDDMEKLAADIVKANIDVFSEMTIDHFMDGSLEKCLDNRKDQDPDDMLAAMVRIKLSDWEGEGNSQDMKGDARTVVGDAKVPQNGGVIRWKRVGECRGKEQ